MTTLVASPRIGVRAFLRLASAKLIPPPLPDHIRSYLPFKKTVAAAKEAGLSLSDYIDARYQIPGATQAAVDRIASYGVLGPDVRSICEIGPGTGRYLEKIKGLCAPCTYEIYETDREWSDWAAHTYQVTAHKADGTTLSNTPNNSVGLVHSHKLFVYIPTIVTFTYFEEMVRVTRPGGSIVFDCLTEECLSQEMIDRWIAARIYYPIMIARDLVVGFFERRNCPLRASFYAPLKFGACEYMVFTKTGD